MRIKEPAGGHLEILSRDELDRIHAATLEVLRRTGMKVWEQESLSPDWNESRLTNAAYPSRKSFLGDGSSHSRLDACESHGIMYWRSWT